MADFTIETLQYEITAKLEDVLRLRNIAWEMAAVLRTTSVYGDLDNAANYLESALFEVKRAIERKDNDSNQIS